METIVSFHVFDLESLALINSKHPDASNETLPATRQNAACVDPGLCRNAWWNTGRTDDWRDRENQTVGLAHESVGDASRRRLAHALCLLI